MGILSSAVKGADLCMIHWLLAHLSRCPVSEKVVRGAAKGGHLWVLQLLDADRSHGIHWREGGKADCLTDAAKAGHWELMKWLDKRASTEDTRVANFDLLEIAVQDNDLEKVKWVVTSSFSTATIDYKNCPEQDWEARIQILRYLLKGGHGDSIAIVEPSLSQAARLGDLATMQWLVARNEAFYDGNVYDTILYEACQHGHRSMVQWLLENVDYLGQAHGPPDVMFTAAKYGRLAIVRWLWEHFSRDPTVALFKDQQNYLDHPFTAMDVAAENGHIEVLQYLDSIDAEIREKTGGKGKKTVSA